MDICENPLNLVDTIRPNLIRMEDSLILALFERARFKQNDKAYIPGAVGIPNFQDSFFEFMLMGTEEVHAKAGRFLHPEEHPFSDNLPDAVVERDYGESPIRMVGINANDRIRELHIRALKRICEEGDDGHYGSSAVWDIGILQTLSRRVHYGLYVAEAKFQENPEVYAQLVKEKNVKGIESELTNEAVEKSILERVAKKGEIYKIDPDFISSFYSDEIIPLTKRVEVEYFLKRGD